MVCLPAANCDGSGRISWRTAPAVKLGAADLRDGVVLRWATGDGKKLAGRGSMLQSSWRHPLAQEVLVGNELSGGARLGRRACSGDDARWSQGARRGAGKLGYEAR
jgi:hypothetical protein